MSSVAPGMDKQLVFTYLEHRRAVGVIGILLPFVLWIGGWLIFDVGIQPSISDYYHTPMRDVLVAALCVIGFFLFAYKGYRSTRHDDIVGNLACLFAVIAALCPTAPAEGATTCEKIVGGVHAVSAILFFTMLIVFCLVLFTRTDPTKVPTDRKLMRNKVYKACGAVMAVCVLLIIVSAVARESSAALASLNPVFWLEALAIWAFGVSWFVKGEAILGD
jgi:hypothetical protein